MSNIPKTLTERWTNESEDTRAHYRTRHAEQSAMMSAAEYGVGHRTAPQSRAPPSRGRRVANEASTHHRAYESSSDRGSVSTTTTSTEASAVPIRTVAFSFQSSSTDSNLAPYDRLQRMGFPPQFDTSPATRLDAPYYPADARYAVGRYPARPAPTQQQGYPPAHHAGYGYNHGHPQMPGTSFYTDSPPSAYGVYAPAASRSPPQAPHHNPYLNDSTNNSPYAGTSGYYQQHPGNMNTGNTAVTPSSIPGPQMYDARRSPEEWAAYLDSLSPSELERVREYLRMQYGGGAHSDNGPRY